MNVQVWLLTPFDGVAQNIYKPDDRMMCRESMMRDTLCHEHEQTEEMDTIGPPDEPKKYQIWLNGIKIKAKERKEQPRRVHAAMRCNAVQWSSTTAT